MKKILIIGGASGIGLSIALSFLDKVDIIHIFDCNEINTNDLPLEKSNAFFKKVKYKKMNLFTDDLSCVCELVDDIDSLIITAGFGRIARFEQLSDIEIQKLIKVNMLAPIRIIRMFCNRIKSRNDFYTTVIGSIAGHITSPLFSMYGASKSGLCSAIKNINAELVAEGFKNRILDVSPGSLTGTSFYGKKNNMKLLKKLSDEIIDRMLKRETLFIPKFNEIYKEVIEKDRNDYIQFGVDSYKYKASTRNLNTKPQIVIGYLSGTFDLFHIGHLNLLKRAKERCDYLIVGVHESGSWKGKETFIPFEERLEIVGSCKYVDEVHKSFKEDSDAWDSYHYDKLFVGSDYKGSERFKKYEEYFKDKSVEIVYFPYTKGTSSTQLRDRLSSK